MHSKRRYNIFFFYSVILGDGINNGFSIIHENFRCNLTFYKSENFSDSSLHHILASKILGSLF